MVFSALTLPPGDDLRLWKDQGQLIRTPTPQNIPTSLPTPSPHISLSNNDFPWPILNPLPGPLAQLFSLISARFIFSLLVLHHSLLFHRIPSSAFKHIHITYSTVRSTFFFFFLTLLLPQTVFICFCFPSNSLKGELLPPPPQHHIFFWPFKADQFPPSVPSGTGSCLNVGITWGPRCFSRGPKAI